MAEEHQELKAVLQGNGEFTKNLYTILAKEPGNVFFSPISIHAILSLAYQGAKGRTQEAFSKALHIPDVRVAAAGYKDVMSHLNSVKDVTLLIANKVFLQETYKLQKSFRAVAVQHFFSKVKLLNFKQGQAAASSINSWVEKKTNNKIRDLVKPDDLTNDTALVLVNAIYFRGHWLKPFDVQYTRTEKFYLNDVDTVDVQMMHIKKKFCYKNDKNLNAKVLQLPYYSNSNISLVVILPNERNGIGELERKLAATDLTKITENMFWLKVVVALPKFKIEQTIDLQDSLTELGLGVIFSRSAELSGIIETTTTQELYVSKVIQKAFIEVNEEGSEAAAATLLRLEDASGSLSPPEQLTADHPFIIILQASEGNTTNVLFKGRISNPQ